jgi:formylglycine-generating enzyme
MFSGWKFLFAPCLWLAGGISLLGLAVGCGPQSQPPAATPKETFAPASALSPEAGSTNGMVWIPGGTFVMGYNGEEGAHPVTGEPIAMRRGSLLAALDERPAHEVTVDGFWMDIHEVTNEEFARFVEATRHVTTAEKKPDPKDFPNVPAEQILAVEPGSIVFNPPPGDIPLDNHFAWWTWVPGANWRQPEGPGSGIKGREKHPVVHVSWHDANAYAKWAGKRLPTEAEWEWAARGGLTGAKFAWGDELKPGGQWRANIWQGQFPNDNTLGDGFRITAPAGSFTPNGYGLHDMSGNVWEWCADWYRHDYYARSPKNNPQGPPQSESLDPNEPDTPKKVQRGGSFLCSDLYCSGYRPSARMKSTPDTSLYHAGFRCVRAK